MKREKNINQIAENWLAQRLTEEGSFFSERIFKFVLKTYIVEESLIPDDLCREFIK